MKKTGFTITEFLITLLVIGMVTALAGPAVSKLMPNKNKLMFIKNYNELAKLTEQMLEDKELYYAKYKIAGENGEDLDGDGVSEILPFRQYQTCSGFECTDKPIKSEYSDEILAEGKTKYAFLLSQYLGVDKADFEDTKDGGIFRTADRTCWKVQTTAGTKELQVWMVYDYEKEDSCSSAPFDEIYNVVQEKVFKSHLIGISNYGDLIPHDALTKAYLLNPHSTHNKKKDLACAKLIASDDDSDCSELDEID